MKVRDVFARLGVCKIIACVAVLFSLSPALLGQSPCGHLRVTSFSEQDQVVNPVPIRANFLDQGCSATTLQLFVDGSKFGPNQSPPNFSADITLSAGSHHIVVEAVNGSNVVKNQQPFDITVVNPDPSCPTGNPCTGVVNIWNPTGCPDTSGCTWKETIPNGNFYVDAKIYSQQANIHVIQVYLDGVKQTGEEVFSTDVSSSSYHSPALPIAVGTNRKVTVQALDNSTPAQVIAKTTYYIDVATPVANNPPTLPTNVFNGIDDTTAAMPPWGTCGTSLDCHAANPPAHSTTIQRDGQSMKFTGDSGSYQEAFWYYGWSNSFTQGLPNNNNPLKYVKFEFDIHIDAAQGAANAPQALEFQQEQDVASFIRTWAWQDDYHDAFPGESPMWRCFDKAGQISPDPVGSWVACGVTYRPLVVTEGGSNVWYHVVLEGHLDARFSTPVLRQDGITIYEVAPTAETPVRQGTEYHNAHILADDANRVNALSTAFQLDSNSNVSGNQYHAWTDNVKVTFFQ